MNSRTKKAIKFLLEAVLFRVYNCYEQKNSDIKKKWESSLLSEKASN